MRWVQDGDATHLGDYSGNLVSVYDMFKALIYVDATVILCKKKLFYVRWLQLCSAVWISAFNINYLNEMRRIKLIVFNHSNNFSKTRIE